MKRTIIAVAWTAGAMIPLLLATVFLVGCCVLPFHGVIHKMMPFCQAAAHLLAGGHDDDHETSSTSVPARQKQEPIKRLLTEAPASFRLAATTQVSHVVRPTAATAYRSFITLGAVRCDRDVGLNVLVQTFLI